MPGAQEIVNSLYGAWRLLRGDANAMTFFNHSIEGFWRSFFAVVLVAPMLLLIVLMNQAAMPADEDAVAPTGAATVFVQLAGFALAWAAYPIAMVWISRMLQLGHRYVGYIIAWNWSNVVGATIMLLVRLIVATEILPTGIAGALSVFAFGYILFYAYMVTKIGLACATGTAIALVIFEVLLEPVIDLSVGGLLRALL
jgi:hypothetical protein